MPTLEGITGDVVSSPKGTIVDIGPVGGRAADNVPCVLIFVTLGSRTIDTVQAIVGGKAANIGPVDRLIWAPGICSTADTGP